AQRSNYGATCGDSPKASNAHYPAQALHSSSRDTLGIRGIKKPYLWQQDTVFFRLYVPFPVPGKPAPPLRLPDKAKENSFVAPFSLNKRMQISLIGF
ncbi:MAG: hypothetical protein ACRC0C_07300, partial [Gibbsiella quercinecans]|uniref:hypothetical protein n=1 Tax=Gibbsiella quercinecans TaxID=929813 RepID=UPI003F3B65CA